MKIKKITEIDQYNTYLHNRIYEVMAIDASEIPHKERMALQTNLEYKILEKRNFFRTGYLETVELFNKVFLPALGSTNHRTLFLAVQARELVPYFLVVPNNDEVDEWIENRIQRATNLCKLFPKIPLVLAYSELCPYRSMSVKQSRSGRHDHAAQVKQLEEKMAHLITLFTEMKEIQLKQSKNRRIFIELENRYQYEFSEIINKI